VAIRISDDGQGIPPEIRDRVFDRFVRGDPSRARQDGAEGGSSGLGLAIAAGLVDLMHGSIAMSSTDAGTTFELRLPAA
jgi:two-component system OmpR family sensor kinase